MTSTQLYLRLLGQVRPYWRVYALAILGMLLTAATEVALLAAAKPFLDGTFIDKDPVLMRWVPSASSRSSQCAGSAPSWAPTPAPGSDSAR
jgi:subfamily B ATP-binding cassette protein MsbA